MMNAELPANLLINVPPQVWPTCPKCGCSIVYLEQKSLDERCSGCFRIDRLGAMIEKLMEATERIQKSSAAWAEKVRAT